MSPDPAAPTALLDVRDVKRHYPGPGGRPVRAVDGVSFTVGEGETVGLVGESGCGKSTLGRLIMGLSPIDGGEVRFRGRTISGLPYRQMRPLRRDMQFIFQDPYASLNPRQTVGGIVEDPLRVHGIGDHTARRARVLDLLARVGLPPEAAGRFPHEFSGGQRQRIGIARALALGPSLIVADEPVSALDVSVQAQVINLLVDLQQEFALSYLFISHDLAVVQHVAHRIVVMYLGLLVEASDRDRIWSQPLHPYTAGLLAAHPSLDPDVDRDALRARRVGGDVPSPLDPPSGCHFHPRCPFVQELCRRERPVLRPLSDGRQVRCHLVRETAGRGIESPVDGWAPIHASS